MDKTCSTRRGRSPGQRWHSHRRWWWHRWALRSSSRWANPPTDTYLYFQGKAHNRWATPPEMPIYIFMKMHITGICCKWNRSPLLGSIFDRDDMMHICIFMKIDIAGFTHRYSYIEFRRIWILWHIEMVVWPVDHSFIHDFMNVRRFGCMMSQEADKEIDTISWWTSLSETQTADKLVRDANCWQEGNFLI